MDIVIKCEGIVTVLVLSRYPNSFLLFTKKSIKRKMPGQARYDGNHEFTLYTLLISLSGNLLPSHLARPGDFRKSSF